MCGYIFPATDKILVKISQIDTHIQPHFLVRCNKKTPTFIAEMQPVGYNWPTGMFIFTGSDMCVWFFWGRKWHWGDNLLIRVTRLEVLQGNKIIYGLIYNFIKLKALEITQKVKNITHIMFLAALVDYRRWLGDEEFPKCWENWPLSVACTRCKIKSIVLFFAMNTPVDTL